MVGGHDVTFGNNLESLWKDFGKILEIFRKDFGKIASQASQTQPHHRHHDCHCHWRHWYHIKSTICSEWDHYTNTRMNCAVQATFIFSVDFLKTAPKMPFIHPFSHSNFGWWKKLFGGIKKNSFGVWGETTIKSNCVCKPDNVYHLWKANTKWFMKSTHKMIYEKQTQSKSNIFVSALCNQHLLKFQVSSESWF